MVTMEIKKRVGQDQNITGYKKKNRSSFCVNEVKKKVTNEEN